MVFPPQAPVRLRPCQQSWIQIYVKASWPRASRFILAWCPKLIVHSCALSTDRAGTYQLTRLLRRMCMPFCAAMLAPRRFARACVRSFACRRCVHMARVLPRDSLLEPSSPKSSDWFERDELMFDLLSCVRVSARAGARCVGSGSIRSPDSWDDKLCRPRVSDSSSICPRVKPPTASRRSGPNNFRRVAMGRATYVTRPTI